MIISLLNLCTFYTCNQTHATIFFADCFTRININFRLVTESGLKRPNEPKDSCQIVNKFKGVISEWLYTTLLPEFHLGSGFILTA